jgi:hypothetical protein
MIDDLSGARCQEGMMARSRDWIMRAIGQLPEDPSFPAEYDHDNASSFTMKPWLHPDLGPRAARAVTYS